ncbi:MAG: NlpC/P60 family protein [Desulfobacteraceae bacterium]|nr:NlpC/P60 family protein [Desulfobacteraceae bacterium]
MDFFYFTRDKSVDFAERILSFILVFTVFLLFGCSRTPVTPSPKPASPISLPSIHYTIQVGAFSNMDNAVRFTEKLRKQDVNAYHFLHHSGLYKVRFGNFSSRKAAVERAKALYSTGIIHDFYIVPPKNYSKAQLRDKILRTADSLIGVPYRWGGESVEEGFDCSGFTMTVYRLNGLDLPRSSRSQWHTGMPVSKSELKKGNLVFFHTASSRRISHVGIYDGNGQFIHAPGKGKKVRRSSLNNRYYKKRYAGAKTYF